MHYKFNENQVSAHDKSGSSFFLKPREETLPGISNEFGELRISNIKQRTEGNSNQEIKAIQNDFSIFGLNLPESRNSLRVDQPYQDTKHHPPKPSTFRKHQENQINIYNNNKYHIFIDNKNFGTTDHNTSINLRHSGISNLINTSVHSQSNQHIVFPGKEDEDTEVVFTHNTHQPRSAVREDAGFKIKQRLAAQTMKNFRKGGKGVIDTSEWDEYFSKNLPIKKPKKNGYTLKPNFKKKKGITSGKSEKKEEAKLKEKDKPKSVNVKSKQASESKNTFGKSKPRKEKSVHPEKSKSINMIETAKKSDRKKSRCQFWASGPKRSQ